MIKLKWKYYEEACDLIGDLQSIKYLLIEFFPKEKGNVNYLHTKYQDWRRKIRDDMPVLQSINGETHPALDEIKSRFKRLVKGMRRKI